MLNFDDKLIIYEIRCQEDGLAQIGNWPESAFGPDFLGLHLEAEFAFIFFGADTKSAMNPLLAEHPCFELRTVHNMTYGQWQDGAAAQPFQVGPLNIVPANMAPTESHGRHNILIDPGLAFGFGGHPTTKACLELLLKVMAKSAPQTALDLGCGTGVLALSAARLGVPEIIAVDYSHLAAQNAQHNVNLNNLEARIEVFRDSAQHYSQTPGELLMANMHFSLQKELLALGTFEKRQHVILSGLFPQEGEDLRLMLQEQTTLRLKDQIRTDRWSTMWLEATA